MFTSDRLFILGLIPAVVIVLYLLLSGSLFNIPPYSPVTGEVEVRQVYPNFRLRVDVSNSPASETDRGTVVLSLDKTTVCRYTEDDLLCFIKYP